MKTGKLNKKQGQILIQVVVFSSIALLFITSLAGWAVVNGKAVKQITNRELAMSIAEAGIEYYRWHLAHSPEDFQDGTESPGSYTHDFKDKDGNVVGQFVLNITPPPSGSTMVAIKSTGKTNADPSISRTVEVRMALLSWVRYSVVANADMRFGEGTEIFGPLHSNGGIRFNGVAHNIVSSAVPSYDDPDHSGQKEFGVHTHVSPVDPLPPAAVPNRPDIFKAGRQFPVPAVDFAGITLDLAAIKKNAQQNGHYLADSGDIGYHIKLKDDDTFDLYKVNSLVSPSGGCNNSQNQNKWGTWSIKEGGESFLGNYSFPSNGLVFVEDDVWVDGQINTARITIASGHFPDHSSTRTSIIVNNDLIYTNYDGVDVIGLVAQGDVNIGMVSEDDLRIDGALISQNGRIGRNYYPPGQWGNNRCSPYHIRSKITLYGMIGTNERYGFAYTDGTGYQTRSINFDTNLLYAPPPSFPLTSDEYQIISWQEVK